MFIANSYKEFKHVNSTTLITIHINNTQKGKERSRKPKNNKTK